MIARLDEGAAKSEAELRVAINTAAGALQLKKVPMAGVSELKKNVTLLQLNGHSIPHCHMWAITNRVATVSVQDGDLDGWAACLSLASRDGEEWTVDSPCFGACLVDVAMSDDDAAFCLEQLQSAAISDTLIAKLNAASVPDEGAVETLLSLIMRVVDAITPAGLRRLQSNSVLHRGAQSVVVVMRALAALLCPEPGLASLDDISFLCPTNATTGRILKDIPRLGRVLLMKVRQTEVRPLGVVAWICCTGHVLQESLMQRSLVFVLVVFEQHCARSSFLLSLQVV